MLGALPKGLLRKCGGRGEREEHRNPKTSQLTPENGWLVWFFFSLFYLSLTRSSNGGRGELRSTTPHSRKRYEKYKNKEAYIIYNCSQLLKINTVNTK